jgi:plastocyanin
MRTRQLVLAAAAVGLSTVVPGSPASAGGGGCHGATLTDAATDEVTMRSACFTPTVARVGVGGTVTFHNGDPMVHEVTGAGGSFGDHEPIAPGESVEHTFDEAGVYPYYCVLHPTMVGAVVVDGPVQAAGAGGGGGGVPTGLAVGAGVVLSAAALAAAGRGILRSRSHVAAG